METTTDTAKIRLSDHFGYGRLLRFALPSIVMMVFASIYSVVDGMFVSNLTGNEALAAVNLSFPLVMAVSSIGFMFGTGGAALVAKIMGQGDGIRANRTFTTVVMAALIAGVTLAMLGALFLDGFLDLLGARESLHEQARIYGLILFLGVPCAIMQNVFQSFFIAAERPSMGLAVTIAAGITNMALDFVFIILFHWGVFGAALATSLGQLLAALASIVFFWFTRHSRLVLMRPLWAPRAVGRACANGSSELLTEVAASIVGTLYNFQLLAIAGADGVAAYSVIMYVNLVFIAIFFGFSMGTGPLVSFQYGAGNRVELKSLFAKSMIVIGVAGVVMCIASQALAGPLVQLFVGYDADLAMMTLHGFRIYALSFLVCGFSIYGSGFFTALNNGAVSAFIAFMRTFVFATSTVMFLPLLFGIDGVWSAIVVAETCALLVTAGFFVGLRKRYHYA